jgi:hypothetical protein
MMAKYSRKSPKKQRKDGGHTHFSRLETVRAREVLGDAYELILNAPSSAAMRKTLNSASWQVKKAVLLEALELGDVGRANSLATQILNLTEVKKQEVSGNVTYNERVEILLAEVTGVPFDVLAERAKQIKESTRLIEGGFIGGSEAEPDRVDTDRRRDEEEESFQVLVVEDGTVQEQTLPIRNRNVRRRPNPSARKSSKGSS